MQLMKVNKIKMVLWMISILGLIEFTKELGAPFITESIWTEALQIVSDLGRGGLDSEG